MYTASADVNCASAQSPNARRAKGIRPSVPMRRSRPAGVRLRANATSANTVHTSVTMSVAHPMMMPAAARPDVAAAAPPASESYTFRKTGRIAATVNARMTLSTQSSAHGYPMAARSFANRRSCSS